MREHYQQPWIKGVGAFAAACVMTVRLLSSLVTILIMAFMDGRVVSRARGRACARALTRGIVTAIALTIHTMFIMFIMFRLLYNCLRAGDGVVGVLGLVLYGHDLREREREREREKER